MDWLDLLAVQGTLKSLLQHHSSKASILRYSAFFIVQLSHLYMTTGKTIALTRWTFVDKVMSLLFNMLSRLVITFLPRRKCLLISWLQSPSAVMLDHTALRSTKSCKTIPHHVHFLKYSWASQKRQRHSVNRFHGSHTGKLHFWILALCPLTATSGIWAWRTQVIIRTWTCTHVHFSLLKVRKYA